MSMHVNAHARTLRHHAACHIFIFLNKEQCQPEPIPSSKEKKNWTCTTIAGEKVFYFIVSCNLTCQVFGWKRQQVWNRVQKDVSCQTENELFKKTISSQNRFWSRSNAVNLKISIMVVNMAGKWFFHEWVSISYLAFKMSWLQDQACPGYSSAANDSSKIGWGSHFFIWKISMLPLQGPCWFFLILLSLLSYIYVYSAIIH